MSGVVAVRNVKFDLLTPQIEKASWAIKDYTAIFVFDDGEIGSGTFVNVCGFTGVLTAHHVAQHLFGFDEFSWCVADYAHRLTVPSDLLEHVPIGPVPKNAAPEVGPDLSFLMIRDPTLVEELQREKLFYHMDLANLSSLRLPLSPKIWAVAGGLGDSVERIAENYKGGPLSKIGNFVGTGIFPDDNIQADFDYIKLMVPAGEFGFPYHFGGMSGGGFWLIPLEIDASGDLSTIGHRPPLLAGVEFAQSVAANCQRILTGHASDSIYTRVRQILEEKRRSGQ